MFFTNQSSSNLLETKLLPFTSISNYIFVVFIIIVSIPLNLFHPLHIFFSIPLTSVFMEWIPFRTNKLSLCSTSKHILHFTRCIQPSTPIYNSTQCSLATTETSNFLFDSQSHVLLTFCSKTCTKTWSPSIESMPRLGLYAGKSKLKQITSTWVTSFFLRQ